MAAHEHGTGRRRESGGVLDQLGQQVGQVGHRPARDLEVLVDQDVDPPVLLDLGGGGPHHLGQRHRPAPQPRRLVAGQHEERLGVAADAGGEVVELEQLVQDVGLALALLEVGDQLELPVEQRLVASGEVDQQIGDGLRCSASAAAIEATRATLRCCSRSVFFQKTISPMQAASTATPWMSRPGPRPLLPLRVVEHGSEAMALPSPCDTTVNATFQRNGTQSW